MNQYLVTYPKQFNHISAEGSYKSAGVNRFNIGKRVMRGEGGGGGNVRGVIYPGRPGTAGRVVQNLPYA